MMSNYDRWKITTPDDREKIVAKDFMGRSVTDGELYAYIYIDGEYVHKSGYDLNVFFSTLDSSMKKEILMEYFDGKEATEVPY